MELDELKTAWAELGRRVEEQDGQIETLRRHGALAGLKSRLRLVTQGQVVQLLAGLLLALWGGSTWTDHWGTWHVVSYGIGLHVYGLALLVTAAMQLARITAVDYTGPIATVQHSLLRLRQLRTKSERILLVIGGVGWVPVVFLVLYNAGLDVWSTRPGNVLANLGVGIGISLALLWSSVRYPQWMERTAQGRHLADIERDLKDL